MGSRVLLIRTPAALAAAAAIGLTILLLQLGWVFGPAPRLGTDVTPLAEGSLTVVIPAYDEAANIGPCLTSLLASAPPCPTWSVLLVDALVGNGLQLGLRLWTRRQFQLPIDH